MDKNKYRKRISEIKTELDVNDLKSDLSKFLSINDRLDNIRYQGFGFNEFLYDNSKEIQKTMNQIVDDYRFHIEFYFRINKIIKWILPIIFKNVRP